jgi:hypothetical protein
MTGTAALDHLPAVLAAALGYAERGWSVIPLWWPTGPQSCACGAPDCRSAGKHPHGRHAPHGLEDATSDPDVIARWWTAAPELNVGLRTGVAFDVLDLDNVDAGQWLARYAHERGEDTTECWAWGPLSITAHGHHLLYAPTGAGNRTAVRGVKGFDWRGRDGYIVAPPSRHETGQVYAWQVDCGPDTPIPAAPAFLAELVATRTAPSRPVPPPAGPTLAPGWADGLHRRMADAVEGERNDVLLWCAASIGRDIAAGRVGPDRADDALARLADIAEARGLPRTEVDRTIRSGLARP